ncbi:MAG: putative bifunctional diguanylate cyclase/phosphodiesterase [Thainema sp.]
MKDELTAYLAAPHQADILIVDDTLENIVLLAQILGGQGYNVRKAISGMMAIRTIEAELPDLILLDICMPDLDGYELCRRLKADPVTASVPVIFLSALNEPLDKAKAFEVGGTDYITKPFQVAEVLIRTRNQLLLKQAWSMMQVVNLQLEEQVRERTYELEQVNRRLREIAYHDQLTGLPNRASLMDCLTRLLQSVQIDPDYQFAVLFFDCDRFKLINDSFGHLVGDEALIQVARRLSTCVREGDMLARFGGDEFVIVLNAVADQQSAIDAAQQVIDVMKPGISLAHGEVFVGASVGIVLSSPIQHQKPEHILRDADIAMYSAKASGKSRYSVFNPVMQRTSLELFQVETDLHRAVKENEFVPFYQPIVQLETGAIAGLEVLIRWQHPERGLLLPHAFLSVAEEAGLMITIGKALLQAACYQLADWRRRHLVADDFYISFNLSVGQLTQVDLPRCLQQTLSSYQLAPQQVRLEITETALLDNALATEVIMELAQQGFHLCIDDFGIGYSSFSYLHQFPVKTLKIDRSFIQNIQLGNRSFQLVTAILGLVQTLQMTAVAEGIETQDQLHLMEDLDCELGQGYFFSKPCAADVITEALIKNATIKNTN